MSTVRPAKENTKVLDKILNAVNYFCLVSAEEVTGGRPEVLMLEDIGIPLFVKLDKDLISRGFRSEEFFILYQPIVNINNNTISGMEALIRWRHPKYGIIGPIEFIPLVEEDKLMIPVGEWVLEQACLMALVWKKAGLVSNNFKVSVNLSAAQLEEKDFLLSLSNAFSKIGPDFNLINLDFDFGQGHIQDNNIGLISELTKKGYTFSLDDFGSYGNLDIDWVKSKGFHTVKIDRWLMGEMMDNQNIKNYIIKTLAVAKNLGIKTLGEGIETKEQLTFLKENGCDFIQGYYFSEPLFPNEFVLLLKACRMFIN